MTNVSRTSRVHRVVRVLLRTLIAASIPLALAWPVHAASPSPSSGLGGDPRSSGQGPGLVGDPVVALALVLAIGLGALVLTVVYLRLTSRRDV